MWLTRKNTSLFDRKDTHSIEYSRKKLFWKNSSGHLEFFSPFMGWKKDHFCLNKKLYFEVGCHAELAWKCFSHFKKYFSKNMDSVLYSHHLRYASHYCDVLLSKCCDQFEVAILSQNRKCWELKGAHLQEICGEGVLGSIDVHWEKYIFYLPIH